MSRSTSHKSALYSPLTTLTPSPLSVTAPLTPPNFLLGTYYGNQGWSIESVKAMESWQGKKNTVVNLFTNWDSAPQTIDNLFKQQLPTLWTNGNIPLVTWEPQLAQNTPDNIEVLIAQGQFDAYITDWATQMKKFLSGTDGLYGNTDDRRAYLRLGHEMNGDWYAWSAAKGNNSTNDFVQMWRHVKEIFSIQGIESNHLQWMWSVNNTDVGGFRAESFYPGDAYVDWMAIDGYNWGTSQSWSSWESPTQVFGDMITRLRSVSQKPIAITEFGSSSQGGNKSNWTTSAFQYFSQQGIKMAVSFNQDKETDWAVFGGIKGNSTYSYKGKSYNAYSSYKTAAKTYGRVSQLNLSKIVTDLEFAGSFA